MFFVSGGFQESDIREDKPSLYHFELVSRSSLYFMFYSFKFNSWSVEIARNFSLSLGAHIVARYAVQEVIVRCRTIRCYLQIILCFATNFCIFLSYTSILLCNMLLT
jgi:hypothetical protein